MGSFLSNESAFGKLMTKIGTLIVLNVLFAVCCIPFVTVGAAAAALYSAVFELLRAEAEDRRSGGGAEINPVRAFVRGLRRYGVRATLVWLGFAGVMGLGTINLRICAQWTGPIRAMSAGVIAVMVFASVLVIFMFPVMASSEDGQESLRQAAALSVRALVSRPLQAVPVIFLTVVPMALIGLDELNRPTYAFVGTFFGFALIAYWIGRILLPRLQMLRTGSLQQDEAAEGPAITLVRRLKERREEKFLL